MRPFYILDVISRSLYIHFSSSNSSIFINRTYLYKYPFSLLFQRKYLTAYSYQSLVRKSNKKLIFTLIYAFGDTSAGFEKFKLSKPAWLKFGRFRGVTRFYFWVGHSSGWPTLSEKISAKFLTHFMHKTDPKIFYRQHFYS